MENMRDRGVISSPGGFNHPEDNPRDNNINEDGAPVQEGETIGHQSGQFDPLPENEVARIRKQGGHKL
ncbi:unnamed protein product, partial [Trichogramma brassicae]